MCRGGTGPQQREYGTAQVTVYDNGPSVPDDDREKIFDRFVRAEDGRCGDSAGSGLGLLRKSQSPNPSFAEAD